MMRPVVAVRVVLPHSCVGTLGTLGTGFSCFMFRLMPVHEPAVAARVEVRFAVRFAEVLRPARRDVASSLGVTLRDVVHGVAQGGAARGFSDAVGGVPAE